jgi:hypothetical protein
MTARIFEWNANSKHRRGFQPDVSERTATLTASSQAKQPVVVALRVMATALVAFWCAAAALVVAWWGPA